MALSSDEIVKREIIETLGPNYKGLKLRIFPEGSNDDQRLFAQGGLTFSKDGIDYGSCDAGWYYIQDGKNYLSCEISAVFYKITYPFTLDPSTVLLTNLHSI